MDVKLAFPFAFAVALVFTPVLRHLAIVLDIVDHPGVLKTQRRPVAYLGGFAVFFGIAPVLWTVSPSLILPLALALALGVADDICDIPPKIRFAVEVLIGIAAASVLPTRGLYEDFALVVLVVALLNAVNLLDGMDALASTVVTVGAFGFAVLLGGNAHLPLALAGGLLGFLVYNRPPASIYLGDGGAYLVGTSLALLLGLAAAPGEHPAPFIGAVLFVAVPVGDTTIAILRRARTRQPLFQGDRSHLYDQLRSRGWSLSHVLGTCAVAQTVFVFFGLFAGMLHPIAAFATVIAVVVFVGIGTVGFGFLSPEMPADAAVLLLPRDLRADLEIPELDFSEFDEVTGGSL